MTGIPPGFDELSRPHENLLDVYFGGRKVGEALAVTQPGFVRFSDPQKVAAMLPAARPGVDLAQTLATDLPANAALACSQSNAGHCGRLSPDTVGVILDEDHFRVDLYVNPLLLAPVSPQHETYLPSPDAPPSLATSMGFAVSGSSSDHTTYNVQNRTILAFRNARIRSDSTLSSHLGLIVDDLVAEVDRPGLRYSGGLFWAPGLDFTGQRRIVGLGIGTQFDTRADRESLSGTPLILFLPQPARVEILVDGRLVGSRAYDAGNVELDTSGLPDGSYPVVLRIQEAGATREERRFLVKNASVPPAGQPIYYAYAGMLANTRADHPVSISKTLYYQLGAARRLTNSIALDFSLLGTSDKTMAEAGAWLLTHLVRVRAAGLVSTTGDRGALLQVGTTHAGSLSVNFDLRRIWSSDGKPLIPLPSYVNNFGTIPATGAQVGEGSYTQATGSIGYRLGSAFVSVIGSLRKDKGIPADYSIGPDVNWPVVNRNGLQLTLEASAQRTRSSTATFAGFRLLYTRRNVSVMSSTGHSSIASRSDAPSKSRLTSNLVAQYSFDGSNRTQGSLSAGIDRNLDGTTLTGSGTLYSRYGTARGDIVHNLDGGSTHYGLTFQSGAALTTSAAGVGGRDLEESALIASVDGDSEGSTFEILVDGQPRGRIEGNSTLPIFLRPYRSYKIRLRPVDGTSAWYDTAPRSITLYPGNVQKVEWHVDSLVPAFGQAVLPDGRPLADAMVRSRHGVGQTDDHGYFQIEVGQSDTLAFTGEDEQSCQVHLSAVPAHKDYARIGEVVCR